MAARWEGTKGRVKKVKGRSSTGWSIMNSHEDVKSSTGNIVDNPVVTVDGARWVLDLSKWDNVLPYRNA